jgi:hypothetical protein
MKIDSKPCPEKIYFTVAFVFILFSTIIMALTPVATGYELTIYADYPIYFWLSL